MDPWSSGPVQRLLGILLSLRFLGPVLSAAPGVELQPGTSPLQVAGLPWFAEEAPILRRLPLRLRSTVREPVWDLAQHPSGARFRFRTDSTRLTLVATNPDASTMHHMTTVGQSGFDLYVDGLYRNSAWPDKSGRIRREWTLGPDRRMREVLLYLPLYKPVSVQGITLDAEARVEPPSAFAQPKPVVYYGSSITQGGCAENPGLSFPAILGRRLNVDFVNLGFSGNGLGELAVAEALAEIDPAAYVLDYWANPSADVFRDTLPPFVETLRRRHPQVPILVTGPFWTPDENGSADAHAGNERKRRIARERVEARRRAGDRHISYVDGLEMISPDQASGFVDGIHPNSLGFQFCADGLEPHLRRALGLSESGRPKRR